MRVSCEGGKLMKKKIVCILSFLILFLLSGCSSAEEMDYEEMENAIVENDPIYLYFNSAPDEISVEKELTENNKEIWIKTSTEYDDFTYLGAYKLDCKLYNTNGEKKWLVDNLEILYDEIRFIPTKYDYSGSWMTEDGHNCYYIDNIDWENGRISAEDDSTFSRELEGYIDNSDGKLRFGMKIKSEDISAFKFEFDSQEFESGFNSYQTFQVLHFNDELFHISQEYLNGIVYQSNIFADSFYEGYNDRLNRSIILKTEDGVEIANADQVMGANISISADLSGMGEQIDFAYDLEDLFKEYVGQDIYIYSFDTLISKMTYTENDIEPFLTLFPWTEDEEMFESYICMDNAFTIYRMHRAG